MLDDEVWRLQKIAKNGVYHVELKQNGIHTVEHFLKLYYKDQKALRNVRHKNYVCVIFHDWISIIISCYFFSLSSRFLETPRS